MNDWQKKNIAEAPTTDKTGRSIDRCDNADPIIIPERDDWEQRRPPGPSWERVYRRGGEGEPEKVWLKPLIRCKCGVLTGIGLHTVHADGRVMASFFHATPEQLGPDGVKRFGNDGCGWHVFIKLDGYDQGDFPPDPERAK